MKNLKIAIIGASGLVGEKILDILSCDKAFFGADLFLFASDKTAGKKMFHKGNEYPILRLSEKALNENFDIVFFSAGEEVSLKYAKEFAKRGAFVIDNTNAFRRIKEIPLVVPEINGNLVTEKTKIIANPNCSTIELAVAINELKKFSNINEIVVSTYQSVSGAGKLALNDLFYETNNFFEKGIKNNIIAQIGEILPSGYSLEEDKIMFELNKILRDDINICATAVRVPIAYCHGESVTVEFEKNVNLQEIKNLLNSKTTVFDDNNLFYPTEFAGKNNVAVFRLREFGDKKITFFILADNLRRGAAYNATEIAKIILSKFFKINQK